MLNISIQLSDHHAAVAWNTSVIIAAFICFVFHWREGRRQGFNNLNWLTLLVLFYATILMGQRVGAFSLLDWSQIFSGHGQIINSKKSILGAGLIALPLFLFFKYFLRLPNKIFDVLFLGFPLALAMGRIGCLLAGCCFGTVCPNALGITYGFGMPAFDWQIEHGLINENATNSLPVAPIQFYIFISNLLIFYFLWKRRNDYQKTGSLALLAISLLFINRFGIEFFRETISGRGIFNELFFGLKYAQWICLLIAGISFFLYYKNKNAPQKNTPESPTNISLNTQTFILLIISIGTFTFRPLLTFDEEIILLIICTATWIVFAKKAWTTHLNKKRILAPTICLSISSIFLVSAPIDSLPMMPVYKEKSKWIEMGISGTYGSFKDISRDCEGNIIDEEKLTNQSINFNASYNWGIKNGAFTLGIRGTMGSLVAENIFDYQGYNYTGFGGYFSLDNKGFGYTLGITIIDQDRNSDNSNFSPYLPHFKMRFGKISRYHFDLSFVDNPSMEFYPEPIISMGFFNWGFKEINGSKNIRVAWSFINQESAMSFSGRTPIRDTPIIIDGTLHLQKRPMLTLGMRYRFDMNWKK